MTHPRQLIREHIARELVPRGAWDRAVFVNRRTPIDQEDHFPNLCIYTQSERTSDKLNNDVRRQELALLIEVRTQRVPDMLQPWRHIDGLPAHPAQTTPADATLDDACEAVEQVVFGLFGRPGRITVRGVEIDFEGIEEVNTDISGSAEGEVPHELAQLEFRLHYYACTPEIESDTCPLTSLFGRITPVVCDENASPVDIGLLVDGQAQTTECSVSVKTDC